MATHALTRAVYARARAQIIRMYYCQRSYRCLQLLADLYVCILNERIHEVLCSVLGGRAGGTTCWTAQQQRPIMM